MLSGRQRRYMRQREADARRHRKFAAEWHRQQIEWIYPAKPIPATFPGAVLRKRAKQERRQRQVMARNRARIATYGLR